VPVALDSVVPWGRSLDEYVRMFDLTPGDLGSRILDCAAGPASFNAEMHRRGRRVVSCDPIYEFSASEIAMRIEETAPKILEATRRTLENFVWTEFESLERLGERRRAAMRQFLDDLPAGLGEGRYRVAELPTLPFADGEFDLALCSHFLFTYSNVLPLEFHRDAIREMCRVDAEARIFPLVEQFGAGHSPHVAAVVAELSAEGYRCEVKRVPYEFQRGGNEMLRVRRA
jgi:SAM-dependent methyltransferase